MTFVPRITATSTGARVKVTVITLRVRTGNGAVVSVITRTRTTYNVTNKVLKYPFINSDQLYGDYVKLIYTHTCFFLQSDKLVRKGIRTKAY